MLSALDYSLILLYVITLLVITFFKRKKDESESDYLLAGRSLTLPAFIATLVSTWYGGILGVGEYGYQYGISQWIVFSMPFYVFAILYAVFFVKRIRLSSALSLPEAIVQEYDVTSGKISAILIFLLSSPAPYFVMLALLLGFILPFGIPYWILVVFSSLFSLIYVIYGGFRAVVRTDILQFALMYIGFFVILIFGLNRVGSFENLLSLVPEPLLHPTGHQPFSYVVVWFFIALWTFVDPGFHQRVSAAKSPKTAKNGILISVIFWFLFDAMTITASLLGVVLLPDLSNPVMVYPELGNLLLPSGFKGLFILGLLATIMSTADSFLFLSGQSISRDLFGKSGSVSITKWGIFASAIGGIGLAIFNPSVIQLWYGLGTCIIPGLLLTVLGTYFPFFKIPVKFNKLMMILGFFASLIWLNLGSTELGAFLGIEPFYVGLGLALMIWFSGKLRIRFIQKA